MSIQSLTDSILLRFPHVPTADQTAAIGALAAYVSSGGDSVFLLKGYAGTGKTTLVAALVKALAAAGRRTALLAPTGRAAKVFSLYAGCKAWTIHRRIYRQKAFSGEPSGFLLAPNTNRHTIFIVDEASMIADRETGSGSVFGSGRLLEDLIGFVYSAEGCRLILMGDEAQLPPVGLAESPALQRETLRAAYMLETVEATLTQVVRQDERSDILLNATALRRAIHSGSTSLMPAIAVSKGGNMKVIRGGELIEELSSAYARDGVDDSIVIVRSNRRAQLYNNGIRSRILCLEEEISAGDRLMVSRNNYVQPAGIPGMDFLANGETVCVKRVRRTYEMYGFCFADLLVGLPDYEAEAEIKVIVDALRSESPALTRDESDRLFQAVWSDLADVRTKTEKLKRLKSDLYFNAVQVKYAYAVTCHKAQGGQWRNVFIDVGRLAPDMIDREFYRWLYTAVTRAEHRLYWVNPFFES
ncbi:MAG: AAA family ATPase [Tannerellaceae bacterium]|jgi:exodeoxyribonuclease-5|nr:AAA family ATPase [Tannerellaceae bacterium]